MRLGLFFCISAAYGQTCCGLGTAGLTTAVVSLPVISCAGVVAVLLSMSLVAWILSSFLREIRVLFGLRLCRGNGGVSLYNTPIFSFLACCLGFFLANVFAGAVFFKEYARSGVFGLNERSHKSACIESNAYSSIYADSGAWDTYLLVAFDNFFRAVFVFSIVPLSEHSVVERMSAKINQELVGLNFVYHGKKNFTLRNVLRHLSGCLLLMMVIFLYVALLTL